MNIYRAHYVNETSNVLVKQVKTKQHCLKKRKRQTLAIVLLT